MILEYSQDATPTTNPAIGTNGQNPAPTSSEEIGGIAPNGSLQPIQVDPTGRIIISPLYPNSNASIFNGIATGVVQNVVPPLNAVGFILESDSSGGANNIRWACGAVATAAIGMLAEPGRDSGYVPVSTTISVIAVTGTQTFSIQWILSS